MSETEVLPVEVHETRSVTTPKGQDIWKAEAQKALIEAQSLKVVDNASYLAVGEAVQRWGARAKGLHALLNPGCQAADKLHSDLVRDRDGCVKPFENAAKTGKAELIAWDQEQKRLRQIEQARLEREAKEQAEAEAVELAAELEKAGLKQEAEAVIAEPVRAPVVVAPVTTPKVEGFSYRSVWGFEVFDEDALVAAALKGEIPRQAVIPNDKFLGEQARSLKTAMNWPGVRVVERKA